jgi:hypothetical protein
MKSPICLIVLFSLAITPTFSAPLTKRYARENSLKAHLPTLPRFKAPFRADPHIIDRSWVTDVTEEQSTQLADSITAYVAAHTKASSPDLTILLLAPTPREQANNPLTLALNNAFRKSGFGLVESKEQAGNAQDLRYQVSRFNDGLWLQLQLNKVEANRFYSLDSDNKIVGDAPFSVREEI